MEHLNCYKASCTGELNQSGGSGVLLECSDCGGTLAKDPVVELSNGEGTIAKLATVLLEGNRV